MVIPTPQYILDFSKDEEKLNGMSILETTRNTVLSASFNLPEATKVFLKHYNGEIPFEILVLYILVNNKEMVKFLLENHTFNKGTFNWIPEFMEHHFTDNNYKEFHYFIFENTSNLEVMKQNINDYIITSDNTSMCWLIKICEFYQWNGYIKLLIQHCFNTDNPSVINYLHLIQFD